MSLKKHINKTAFCTDPLKKERGSIYGKSHATMTKNGTDLFTWKGHVTMTKKETYKSKFIAPNSFSIFHKWQHIVRTHSGNGFGHCYMNGRGPNSCLLGHVTGLFSCLYVNSIYVPFSTLLTFEAVCLAVY